MAREKKTKSGGGNNDPGLNFKAPCPQAAENRDFSLSASHRCHPLRIRRGEGLGVRWRKCQIQRHADNFRTDLPNRSRKRGIDFVPVRKVLANPPFNMSDWGGENVRQDVRWKFRMQPVNNALLFGGESQRSLIA